MKPLMRFVAALLCAALFATAADARGQTVFCVDAHRDDGKRYIVFDGPVP